MMKLLSLKHLCLLVTFFIFSNIQFAEAQCGPDPTITVTPGERCGTGTVTVYASATNGWTVDWYSSSTGGSYLGSGDLYNTPSINTSKTYWVSASLNGCTTATRVSVLAEVKPIPIIGATVPGSRCAAGTVALSATTSGGDVNWYATSNGGSSLYTGTSFTTPSISSTTAYYAEAVLNGCVSSSRTAITATVNSYPANQIALDPYTFCSNSTTAGVYWSTSPADCRISYYPTGVAASGGTGGPGYAAQYLSFTPVTTTTNYTLQGETYLNGCTTTVNIPITVKPAPANQILTGSHTFCSNNTNLGITWASGPANCRISYYPTGVTGGGGIGYPGYGVQFLNFTPVTVTTSYTLQGQTYFDGCTTTVDIPITVKPVPTMTLTPASRCSTGTVTLGATVNTGTVNWYATQGYNPTVIGTGTSFTTPSISSTTTYYAKAFLDGCGTIFQSAAATVVAPPTTAAVTGTQYPVCGPYISLAAKAPEVGPFIGKCKWQIISPYANVSASFTNDSLINTKLHIAAPFNTVYFTLTVSNAPCASSVCSTSVLYANGGCNSARMDLTAETEENTFMGETNIIPNPTIDNFNITINSLENKEVGILISDMNGMVVKEEKIITNKQYQFGEELIAGMYVIKIVDGTDIKTYKVVKTK